MARNTKTTTISATIMVAAAMILVALPVGTSALSPAAAPGSTSEPFAPAPSPDCFTYLLGLQDCLSYVGAGSNLTKPEKKCCPELANLVAVQPICLCLLLAHPEQSPVPLDMKKALGLPAVCKVKTPPLSACGAAVPGAAPGGAPVPSAGGPAGPTITTGSLSPQGSPRNGGQSIVASQRHFLVGLAIALFVGFF